MQIIVNGLLVDYDDLGKGKVVLILHGWADSKSSFNELSNDLSKKYRVIKLDLPGHGATGTPDEPWDLHNFASFIQEFLAKLNIKNVHAAIGHSNGGAIAIKAFSERLFLSDKLILLASAGIRAEDTARKKSLKIIAKSGKAATSVLPAKYQNKIKSKFYNAIGSDALVLPQMRETFVKIVAEDLESEAKGLNVPTLLIYGEIDQDAPMRYGEKFHKAIPNSRLETIPGAGHFLHHTHSHEVTSLINQFLKDEH